MFVGISSGLTLILFCSKAEFSASNRIQMVTLFTSTQLILQVADRRLRVQNKKIIPACRVLHRHTVRCQIVRLLGQGGGGGISLDARESTGRITDATRYVHSVAFLLFICTVPSNSTMLLYISIRSMVWHVTESLSFVCIRQSTM